MGKETKPQKGTYVRTDLVCERGNGSDIEFLVASNNDTLNFGSSLLLRAYEMEMAMYNKD